MATYEDIYGKRVKDFDSDPTLTSSYEGQVWYDKSTGVLKSVVTIEAWRSGTVYPRQADHTAGSGTQTAALSCSDNIPSPSAEITSTFEYNGSGWSAGGSMNTQRGDGTNNMTGSQTASFYVGGRPNAGPPTPFGSTATEEYDGSSWTAGGAYPAGMRGTNAFGILTAGVNAGGNSASPSVSSNVNNEYNGTSWTSGNNNTLGRFNCSSSGTSTAGILVAGFSNPPPVVNTVTEEYDGSSWTSGGSLPEARNGLGGSGTQTANIVFGGASPPGTKTTTTSKYDGTSWTTSPATLATGREKFGSAKGASQTSTLAWCGNTPTDVTEEYDASINTITAAAWSSGGAYPTATDDPGSAGTRTAGLVFSGQTPAPAVTQATNEYNGSTFSSGGNTVVGRGFMAGLGTQTAAVGVGGAPSFIANSESYDGSSWSEGNDINTARGNAMGAGIQTAGLIFGGYNGSSLANTENYNGTSWTNNPNGLNTARRGSGGCGTNTAALCAGGYATDFTAVVEEYNGTSWSEVNNLPLKRNAFRLVGTQTAALGFGGYLPGPQGGPGNLPTNSIIYDGTTWSTNPSLATGSQRGGQAGTTTSAFTTAGQLGSGTTTENFDGEVETVTAKTLTTS